MNPCQPDSSTLECAVDGADSPHALSAQRPSSVVFEQPWQAQIFALVVQLNERGVFSWPEWSATLGEVLAQTPPMEAGAQRSADSLCGALTGQSTGVCVSADVAAAPLDGAWEHWPVALERLLVRKAIAAPGALVALRQAWQRADESTPHGQPVRLGSGFRHLSGGYAPDAAPGSADVPGHARNP